MWQKLFVALRDETGAVPIALLLPMLPGLIESAITLVKAIQASGELTDAQAKETLDDIEARLDQTMLDVAALPIRSVPEEDA